jgi:hypothetical protein
MDTADYVDWSKSSDAVSRLDKWLLEKNYSPTESVNDSIN